MIAPALLTDAGYYGTLAAVRCLGRAGIDVVVADPKRLCVAGWSRFARRREVCPPTTQPNEFIDWLLERGHREPGMVLYPTSDDTAFLYALHSSALRKNFRLFQPGVEVIESLLDKRKLYDLAKRVGLSTPRTWFPTTELELDAVAEEARWPVMVKPVTQILFSHHLKGQQVARAEDLRAAYRRFASEPYGAEFLARDPRVGHPMVQEFHIEAGHNIYSLSGFIAEDGTHALRAARKLLQRPRQLGVGICFEAAPIDGELAARVIALCRQVGYYGVFEVEMIQVGGESLLIDFNPRYFGQMAFDIARDLPLPVLVHASAFGEHSRVHWALLNAQPKPNVNGDVYCHRMAMQVMLAAQRLSGALSADEARSWKIWRNEHSAVDAVIDTNDLLPAALEAADQFIGYAQHPRAFLRNIVLNRA